MSKKKHNFFERAANKITQWAGSSYAFGGAALLILAWIVSGPVFGYSDTWQLVINTGTTIITFLMVFLIQKTQNKDSKAVQLKLNELIAASREASNRMVDIEDLDEEELDLLHRFYRHLSERSQKNANLHESHSIDAADALHDRKSQQGKGAGPQKQLP
ncbi:low affinity iron permease family protein [Taibaiella helva]|uniref:low affinity iron permease family protein n=1 Tax=Taibaiella helva TaxID=2301235 RepID=UPI000E58A344|nr:low affinity iron permease family protein [Taibaiella helva]